MSKKLPRILHVLLVILICLSVVHIAWLMSDSSAKEQIGAMSKHIEFIETSRLGDDRKPLTGSESELADSRGVVFLGHFSRDIHTNEPLVLKTEGFRIQILVNDKEIYSTGRLHTGNRWQTVYGYGDGIKSEDMVEIRLSPGTNGLISDGYKVMNSLRSGMEYEHFYYRVKDNIPDIILSSITWFIGIILLVGAAISKKARGNHTSGLFLFAGYVLSCGLWFSVDSDYFTAFIPYPEIMFSLQILSLGFMPIFALGYISQILKNKKTIIMVQINLFFIYISQFFYLIVMIEKGRIYGAIISAQIIMMVSLLGGLGCMIYEANHFQIKETRVIRILLGIVFVGAAVDTLDYILDFTEHSYLFHVAFLIALLIMIYQMFKYIFHNMEEAKRAAELENDLLQSKISIMLSQIKPHFMFNTLNAISALCLTDPFKADETIVKFSDYLRENINSLEAATPIPFQQELSHVKNYVEIEQVRFGEKLQVVYDICFIDFKVPTLTLQPIVENSIRHGIGKKKGNGLVSIRSVCEEGYAVTTVEDDGVGFDMTGDYKRENSIGMENIKLRLEHMVGADIQTESKPGIGTKTVIKIRINEEGME